MTGDNSFLMNLSTEIGGIKFDACIWNAAGAWCTTFEELKDLANSEAGAILSKSCTLEAREGNPHPKYYQNKWGTINSNGLENLGYKKYIEFASQLKKISKKPYLISFSGIKSEENFVMLKDLSVAKDVDMLEFNPGSPNTIGKPIVGYDFEAMDGLLARAKSMGKKPWGVKLPPYFDIVHFDQIAKILNNHQPDYVCSINSLGNSLIIDPEKEQVVIKPKGGLGGVGGAYTKPTGLANIYALRKRLNEDIKLVGVGGVMSGMDAFEYILAGADAVQTASALMMEGPSCFARIKKELSEVMERKGYRKISDFKGKLKEIE